MSTKIESNKTPMQSETANKEETHTETKSKKDPVSSYYLDKL